MVQRPGDPVRSSTSGRPIMVLLDIIGKRWTLRILWELFQCKTASFRALRENCDGVSPTLLNSRLKDLRELNLVVLRDDGYALTEAGLSLSDKLAPLDVWANEWAKTFDDG